MTMAEYIEREAVLKILRGSAIAKYPMSFSFGLFAAADELEKIPAADVVEVCRCKDCKHYKPPKVSAHYVNHTPYCTRIVTMKVKPYDFCSYGEWRETDG